MAKILVNDDSGFSRRQVVRALQQTDHEILEAADGQAGLDLFQTEQPDCVVTDLLMPVMDGMEFIRQVRLTGSTTPIIVVSADIQSSSRTICEDLGIHGFINKPFVAKQLIETVAEALRTPRGALT